MISRDWICLNRSCGQTFHSYDNSPACPGCGNVRVSWVPGGGHIVGERTKHNDRTVRGLAEAYGFTDLNSPSPSRLNRSAPRHWVPVDQSMGTKHFAPGFSAPIRADGAPSCTTSETAVRGSRIVGQAIPMTGRTTPGPEAATRIEGRYYGRGPS